MVFLAESTTSPFWFVKRAESAAVSGEPTEPTETYTVSEGANWKVGSVTRFPSPMRFPIMTCVTLSVLDCSSALAEAAAAAALSAVALSACSAREGPPWQFASRTEINSTDPARAPSNMRAPWVRLLVRRRFAPFDFGDAFDLAHRLHHLGQVRKIVYLDEDSTEHRSILGVQVCPPNVGTGLADGLHDIRIETAPVLASDSETHRE